MFIEIVRRCKPRHDRVSCAIALCLTQLEQLVRRDAKGSERVERRGAQRDTKNIAGELADKETFMRSTGECGWHKMPSGR